ncbi:MAG: NAD-dependent succinate-semialdehyde dehydrogenase [Chlamydiia bacterium]|nr:NAD-dependent succinate-semialdehyde dehydrogenase [Chlamydiia bacterium]
MDEFILEDIGSMVNGRLSYQGDKHPLISPVSGKEWGKIAFATKEEIDEALQVVEEHPHLPLSPYERAALLESIANDLMADKEDIAQCITLDMGKPMPDARGEVTYAANYFKWFAEEVKRVYGKTIPSSKENKKLEIRYEPIGPCAVITPWNFPVAMAARKIAPALAAGCPVIVKPSSFTPASMMMFMTICAESALPLNALQVLFGKGEEIVPALMNSPAIRKFSFTGSSEIGTDLYMRGAKTLKKATLELGGNAPFIVFEDANIDAAAKGAAEAKFRMSGQTCICVNRIFVHKSIEEEFLKKFSEIVSAMVVGDPREEKTELSTCLHPESLRKSEIHVQDALKKGAKAYLGRKELYQAEILTDVTPEMLIFNEETFAPVAPIITFTEEDEVIKLANQTPYGLASYVYTENLKRAERMIKALQFGIIGLNDPLPSAPEASFGGIKSSGFGREGGPSGIYEYLSEKFISQTL